MIPDNDDIFNRPGIVIVCRADFDGWPQGMPVKYVGPFPDWEAYQAWRQREYGHGTGWHLSWHVLEAPEGVVIEEEP